MLTALLSSGANMNANLIHKCRQRGVVPSEDVVVAL